MAEEQTVTDDNQLLMARGQPSRSNGSCAVDLVLFLCSLFRALLGISDCLSPTYPYGT